MFREPLIYVLFNVLSLIIPLISHLGEGKSLKAPDFASEWLYIESTKGKDQLKVNHNLAEMPVYVQVQVKKNPSTNSDYIFPAIGIVPRDDDRDESYGGITYLYNERTVTVSAYSNSNNVRGRVIYTENSQYWEGPNAEDSYSGYIRVRAWKSSSFPKPDYHISGVNISASCPVATDCLYERHHGFKEYPSLVIVRTKLKTQGGTFDGYMSDAVGTVVINSGQQNGYVFYGFDRENIRVWTDSSTGSYIFYSTDGTSFNDDSQWGFLEIIAWNSQSLVPYSTKTKHSGVLPGQAFEMDSNFQAPAQSEDILVHLWAEALDRPNTGFRFASGGALAYSLNPGTFSCTYGGLVYAYKGTSVRTWKPGSSNFGKTICVPTIFAGGRYSQASNQAEVKAHMWIPGVNALHWSCNKQEDCYYEYLHCINLTCECTNGFYEFDGVCERELTCNDSVPVIPDIERRSRNDSSGNFTDENQFVDDSKLKTSWYSATIQNETLMIPDVNTIPTGTACGSKYQAYINGTHPPLESLTETPINLSVCFNDCTEALAVPVRMCPGGRLQYRLPRMQLNDTAYCIDPPELQGLNVSTLHWNCSESRDCFDEHSDCISGTCQCDIQHYEYEGICRKNLTCNDNVPIVPNLGRRSRCTFVSELDSAIDDSNLMLSWYTANTQEGNFIIPDITTPPATNSCGSTSQLYINEPHPSLTLLTDKPTILSACYNNCTEALDILVRMCPGNILQYQLQNLLMINSSFCFDPPGLQGLKDCSSRRPDGPNLGLIMGLTFGLLLAAVVFGILFLLNRKFRKKEHSVGDASTMNAEHKKIETSQRNGRQKFNIANLST